MTCTYSPEVIDKTITFHGHSCPGLAIGIRVAEYVKLNFSGTDPSNLVCVTETDMCGVDAIQYLTGCTYGKGNLIHRDFGKSAFSFYDRKAERGVRLLLQPDSRGGDHDELALLMGKNSSGDITESEKKRLSELREALQERLMALPLNEIFQVQELQYSPPRPARVLQSLVCDSCNEQTMESRTRRFGGQTLCIPCYEQVEQKI